MIFTKCIFSLQENCTKISVEDISYDVSVRLISSMTSFPFNFELVVFRKYKTLDFFSPILCTGMRYVSFKYSETTLVFLMSK